MQREVPPPSANPEDGEVLLVVRGKDGDVKETFVLRLNTNAICRLEKAMNKKVGEIARELALGPGLQDLRAMLFAGLLSRHPIMSMNDAGDLIDRVGMPEATAAVMEAFNLGFPVPAKGAEAEKAEAGKGHGTGNGSSPTRQKRGSARGSSLTSRPGS